MYRFSEIIGPHGRAVRKEPLRGQSTSFHRHLRDTSLTCTLAPAFIPGLLQAGRSFPHLPQAARNLGNAQTTLRHLAQNQKRPFFPQKLLKKKKLLRFAFYSL
jgi:hypothetical protein